MNKSPSASKYSIRGFTLVEIVVVITILAILGTIGFLSVGGFSSRARDSQRVTDIANLAKSLDLAMVTSGSYPMPDNYFTVTYSGGTVWYQGTASNGVLQQLHSGISWGGLAKKPVDPLDSSEYIYSSLAYGKSYQIAVDYENEGNITAFLQTAYAAPGDPKAAYVRGNYGGLAAKTMTGSSSTGTIYVIAVPSILSNTGSIGQSIEISANLLSGKLLFHGKPLSGASTFNPNFVVFSGSTLPSDDTSNGITSLMTLLRSAYSGSDIAGLPNISALVASTSTGQLVSLGNIVIASQLWGKASSVQTPPATGTGWTVAGGGDCGLVDNTKGSDGNTSNCTDGRTYNHQDGAIHSKTYNLLKIGGKWWFNQNLAYPLASGYRTSGAAWGGGSDLGYYSCPGNNSSLNSDCSLVASHGYMYQWSAAMAGGGSNNNQLARTTGICPSGWAIPTREDFTTTSNAYWPSSTTDSTWAGSTTGWLRSYTGYRDSGGGNFVFRGAVDYFWTSYLASAGNAWYVYQDAGMPNQSYRGTNGTVAFAFVVRCIKN